MIKPVTSPAALSRRRVIKAALAVGITAPVVLRMRPAFAAYPERPVRIDREHQRTLRVGGVFHLWGHSWELDQADLWDGLEDVLKMMGDVRGQAPCLTNGRLCQQQQLGQADAVGDRRAAAEVAPS